jgi:hypothetical protein
MVYRAQRRKEAVANLRIGLTISGAVSLGAYEGGALAALLVAVQQMGGAVALDAVTGASAGAITAVLTARCLLRGVDPLKAMTTSWVELPSLARLAADAPNSPLSADVLTAGARTLLGSGPDGLPEGDARQQEDVHVSLTLASLGGFGYRIKALEHDTPVQAVTHLDWANFHFTSETDDTVYQAAAEAALASAANAVGFPPKLLKRSQADIDRARANGICNPPGPDGAWYTDGGIIENEPFGRLLDVIPKEAGDENRLLLLVHPHPVSMPGNDLWVDAHHQPRWTRTALRAKKLEGVQSIYDDLRRLEKTNTRLASVEKLVAKVDKAMAGTGDGPRQELASALRAVLVELHDEHVAINEEIGRRAPGPDTATDALRPADGGDDLADLLRAAIQEATGLGGKRPVKVEIVSPALDHSGLSSEKLLAGERLGHFFGFLDERFRRNDFAVGYRNMRSFLEKTLPKHGAGDGLERALTEVDARFKDLGWPPYDLGGADLDDLGWRDKFRLLRLGGHVGHLVWSDVHNWDRGLPTRADSA